MEKVVQQVCVCVFVESYHVLVYMYQEFFSVLDKLERCIDLLH